MLIELYCDAEFCYQNLTLIIGKLKSAWKRHFLQLRSVVQLVVLYPCEFPSLGNCVMVIQIVNTRLGEGYNSTLWTIFCNFSVSLKLFQNKTQISLFLYTLFSLSLGLWQENAIFLMENCHQQLCAALLGQTICLNFPEVLQCHCLHIGKVDPKFLPGLCPSQNSVPRAWRELLRLLSKALSGPVWRDSEEKLGKAKAIGGHLPCKRDENQNNHCHRAITTAECLVTLVTLPFLLRNSLGFIRPPLKKTTNPKTHPLLIPHPENFQAQPISNKNWHPIFLRRHSFGSACVVLFSIAAISQQDLVCFSLPRFLPLRSSLSTQRSEGMETEGSLYRGIFR